MRRILGIGLLLYVLAAVLLAAGTVRKPILTIVHSEDCLPCKRLIKVLGKDGERLEDFEVDLFEIESVPALFLDGKAVELPADFYRQPDLDRLVRILKAKGKEIERDKPKPD